MSPATPWPAIHIAFDRASETVSNVPGPSTGTSSKGEGEEVVVWVVLCVNGNHLVHGEPVVELFKGQGVRPLRSTQILNDPGAEVGSTEQHGTRVVCYSEWNSFGIGVSEVEGEDSSPCGGDGGSAFSEDGLGGIASERHNSFWPGKSDGT